MRYHRYVGDMFEAGWRDNDQYRGASSSPDNETITWDIPFVSETNPATMTYIVEIHPEAQSGVVYPTNGDTPVEYTNALGNRAEKEFDVPEVGINAGTIVVHYFRVNAAGQPVNSEGAVISREGAELDQFTFREGTQLELNVPHSVFFSGSDASVTTRQIGGLWYSYSSAGDTNPTIITLTTSEPSQDVWFACLPAGAPLSITSYEDEYDSAYHSITVGALGEEGNTIWFSEDNESWSEIKPEYMKVGNYTVYVKVTNPNYAERRGSGTVKITAKPLVITAGSATKTYDGAPLTNASYTYGELAGEDVIVSVTVEGSQTEVGSSANVPKDSVIKRGDAVVTDNYNITYVNGTLTVTLGTGAELDITNYEGVYDGLSHTITVNNLVTGDEVRYSKDRGTTWLNDNPGFVNVGTYEVLVKVTNPNYADRTGSGTVTITARPVTVKADAKTKTYGDVDPVLTYEVTSGSLVSGDAFTGELDRVNWQLARRNVKPKALWP